MRSLTLPLTLLALSISTYADAAHAQAATATSEPAPTEAPRTASPSGTDDVRYRDAHADRVILGSTAETNPKGTFFVSDYEIFLLQLGYAVTDELQLQLTGLPPFIKNQPAPTPARTSAGAPAPSGSSASRSTAEPASRPTWARSSRAARTRCCPCTGRWAPS